MAIISLSFSPMGKLSSPPFSFCPPPVFALRSSRHLDVLLTSLKQLVTPTATAITATS